jgi:hypothetical protein
VGGVIEAVLVEDQGLRERADLEQALPVRRAAGQARDLKAEHHPHLAEADRGDQLLETGAVTVRPREPLVAVDDQHPLRRPAQGDGALAQGVLALRALAVLEHLAQRALADVEVGEPLQVAGRHFQVLLGVHAQHLLRLESAISASTRTSSALASVRTPTSRGPAGAPAAGRGRLRGGQAHIQPATPARASTARPRGLRGGLSPRAWARRAS